MVAHALVLMLLACGAPEAPPPPPGAPAAPAVDGEQVERGPVVIPAAEGSVPVMLAFQGVGNLHKGYFRTDDLVGGLSDGLAGCVDDHAEVMVAWDGEKNLGTILLHTVGTQLTCRPSPTPEGFDMRALQRIGQTLAGYRDGVAGRFDLRIASFRTGVRVLRGTQVCDVWFGGQFPPDGSTMSPCVHLQGHEVCMGPRHDGVTELVVDGDTRKALKACFAP